MAITQIQARSAPNKVKKGSEGGGAIGRKIGMVAGAVVGGMAGGNVATGASLGAGLGGQIGEMAKPGTADQVTQANQSPGMQNVQKSDTTLQLEQSLAALKTQPPPTIQKYGPTLAQAYMTSLAQDNPKPGVA